MKIHAELWMNQYGDSAIFIGDEYVIYDKCDRLGAEVVCVYEKSKTIAEFKNSYYKNGFRPVNENIKAKSSACSLCKHFMCCSKDGGCCGDDVLSKPCCTCTRGVICPGQHGKTDNFEIISIEEYENNLKEISNNE